MLQELEAPGQELTTKDYDTRALAYIQALLAGLKTERPANFGQWELSVANIERAYAKTSGNLQKMQEVVQALVKTDKHLARLLISLFPPEIEDISPIESVQELGVPSLPESAVIPAEASRGACAWLDRFYVPFSMQASPESYEDFHIFVGMWALSTVAGGRVHLQFEQKRFSTNLMIALCADSSMFVKSVAADVAKNVLVESKLDFFLRSDRISPQKLLSSMSGKWIPEGYANMSIPQQRAIEQILAMPGQCGLFQDEFGKFVKSMLRKGSISSDFVDILLKLDACPREYGGNDTIQRGSEPIARPHLSLLGSMTLPDLKENAKQGADFWTDGFWARFAFVCAPPPTLDNIKISPFGREARTIPRELTSALISWHHRLGVPQCQIIPLTDDKNKPTGKYQILREDVADIGCSISEDAYQAWAAYYSALKKMCLSFSNADLNGSYVRLAEKALRMAIIMASLENNNRIELRHWARAQELAEFLRTNLHELYAQVNTSSITTTILIEDHILAFMKEKYAEGKYEVSIRDMQRGPAALKKTADILKDACKNLMDAKEIIILDNEVSPQGRPIYRYQLHKKH